MENKFLKIDNKANWQDLLDKVLFKTFFHFLEWEDFLEKNFNWLKFERYLWPAQGGQVILSLARIRILGQEKLISHPFCEYGGPLPLVEKVDGQRFQKELFEEFKTPFKISFHPKLLNYFKDIEFPENERETLFFEEINQKSADEIWRTLDRNRRRSINSALAQNLEVRECKNLKELKVFYHFYVKNLKRHQALPYPFSFFRFFFNHPQAKILLAKKEKKIVGGNLFLHYNEISHSFLCGFEEKYRKLGVHSLVLWEKIKQAQAEGCGAFDFGATRKTSSIRDFKGRWGAKTYPIFELKNYSGQSKLKDSFLRDVWSWLPVSLIKILSPYFIKYKL